MNAIVAGTSTRTVVMDGAGPGGTATAGKRTAIRTLTHVLWALVAVAEILLLLRITAVAIWGINGDFGAPNSALNPLYSFTGLLSDHLGSAANFLVPYQGLHHAFDIASLMGIAAVFFVTLAVTKIALWAEARFLGRS